MRGLFENLLRLQNYLSRLQSQFILWKRDYRDADKHHVSSVSAYLMKYCCRCVCVRRFWKQQHLRFIVDAFVTLPTQYSLVANDYFQG